MSNLAVRVLTAVIGIPLVLGVTYVGGWPFALLLGIMTAVAAVEFFAMMRAAGHHPSIVVGVPAAAAIAFSPVVEPRAQAVWVGILVLAALLGGLWFMIPRLYPLALAGWTTTMAGILYVGVLAGHLALLRQLQTGAWWVVVALIVTWAYDTGAYFAGSLVGRRPFMQHISPRKTQEGVLGGVVLSALAGLVAVPTVGLTWWQGLVFGALAGLVGQAGDLLESMLKRQAGVKDSGTIIPGHGGLLDRIDGLLFTGALTYYVAALLGHAS